MKDTSRIVFLLDSSGSMEDIKETTIKSFNQFIAEQKKENEKGKVKFSLITFSTKCDPIVPIDIHEVRDMNAKTFRPDGSTALYDAMAITIDDLGKELASLPEEERPRNVTMVVLTDGEENASRRYTQDEVFTRVNHQQQKYSWHFIYLGANQDAIQEARKMGICRESAIDYGYNEEGVCAVMSACSAAVSKTTRGDKCAFSQEDRDRCGR